MVFGKYAGGICPIEFKPLRIFCNWTYGSKFMDGRSQSTSFEKKTNFKLIEHIPPGYFQVTENVVIPILYRRMNILKNRFTFRSLQH